ncbi:MAG: HYR domain-containing protein, partial [Chloroflexi bacterium]|nr:HYR domain-containing protein [Chloroflexota bacterium]
MSKVRSRFRLPLAAATGKKEARRMSRRILLIPILVLALALFPSLALAQDGITLEVPADIVAEAEGPDGAFVTYTATASDVEDGALTPVCSPASESLFPLGTTTVTCTATDSDENSASANFDV